MTEHPNIDLFKRTFAAFTSGDMERLAELFAEDVVWHTPGSNPLSGEYRNRDDAFVSFGKVFELSGGTYRPEVHDVLATDDHTVALLHTTATRNGKTLDGNEILVFHIRDGKIAEAWEAWFDEAAWNEFWL
jgi:uncharacterized protein